MQIEIKENNYTVQQVLDREVTQNISFIGKDESGELVDGITVESLIKVAYLRLKALNKKSSNKHNYKAIENLEEAMLQLKERQRKKLAKKNNSK